MALPRTAARALLVACVLTAFCPPSRAAELAITLDDPGLGSTPLLGSDERNARILAALDAFHVEAALFVCGRRVDSRAGHRLLQTWDEHAHLLANHSYSHAYFHSAAWDAPRYWKDFERAEKLISGFAHFTRLARFPMLKEGNTVEKRDGMRALMAQHGYQNGVVTIDASDWYIDQRLEQALRRNPDTDLTRYRRYYLDHLWDRAVFYDQLARQVLGHGVKHTLLIHHNLLNALFLKDVLVMFASRGWTFVSASSAYADPLLRRQPMTLPAGESLVWALAKETGRYDAGLRYPGEDGEYLEAEMDRLGL